jgi:hypothetical protein
VRTPIENDPAAALMNGTLYAAFGTPDAIAHAAIYLASDESQFINGTVIDVDGGRGRSSGHRELTDNGPQRVPPRRSTASANVTRSTPTPRLAVEGLAETVRGRASCELQGPGRLAWVTCSQASARTASIR